ncbi:J domain-containing protein [Durusdinium trenchii]|uniref:J domain-containing protein n=1 Tax=Durusdinium trenchii TaxID=1381693 RepID=A0ABP0MCT9_9DINO
MSRSLCNRRVSTRAANANANAEEHGRHDAGALPTRRRDGPMEKSSSGKYFFKSHLMNLGVLLQFQVFLQSPSALAIRGYWKMDGQPGLDSKTCDELIPQQEEEFVAGLLEPPQTLQMLHGTQVCEKTIQRLSHCGCPWGGRLIKVDLEDVRIENAPEKTGKIIVRPEVRAAFQSRSPLCGTKMTLERFICPGEAVLKGLTSTKLFRLCAVLFGEMSAGTSSSFCFHDAHFPVALHHKIRRDYPKEGNSATAFWEETGSLRQEGIFLIQPSGTEKLFFATAVVRLPHDKFASWATFQFRTFLTLAHRTCNWLLNRPGIVQLRAADESFYVILQIQSFQRGFPLVPVFDEERAIVTIDAGEALGFRYWTRFQSERFHLRQYLKCFLAAIGQEIEIFDTLDSRRLVPYQCVVCRSQWEAIRARFLDIFRLAKTAYRRANGGTVAPGMQDGVEPRFVPEFHHAMQEGQKRPEAQLVVRNTFLDLQEEEDREMSEMSARPLRRPRTTQF